MPKQSNKEPTLEISKVVTDETEESEGIKNSSLRRILLAAGGIRLSADVYGPLRIYLTELVSDVVRRLAIFVKHGNRKTTYSADLRLALQQMGVELAAGLNTHTKKGVTPSLRSCKSLGMSSGTTKKTSTAEGVKKQKHRYRPGTVARRTANFYQKHSDCLFIPSATFRTLVRSYTAEVFEDMQYAKGVISLLQLVVETRLISLCRGAHALARHAKRETITADDVTLSITFSNGSM
jgi:histone H3/H4